MAASRWFTAISQHFRRKRMQRFVREFALTSDTRVLDVGGVPDTWSVLAQPPQVVLLNTPRTAAELAGAKYWVAGDGRCLPFRDQSFDIVFSNSVIEHVGDAASQERFAREVARVGRGYWVQTPNRSFPVEQHLLTPFLHWLPRRWQRVIVPHGTVWGALTRVASHQRQFFLKHYLDDVRLLTAGELMQLFPDARLVRERFCGVTKSLMAVKRP
jgi:ubiquinone/menaquinone biosynthesis C-methylase UbiE